MTEWYSEAKAVDSVLVVATISRGIVRVYVDSLSVCGWRRRDLKGKRLVSIIPDRYKVLHLGGLVNMEATGDAPAVGSTFATESVGPDGAEHPVWLTVFGVDRRSG